MTETLVLYVGEKNISSWSMRGWLGLAAKGLAFDERTIELRKDKEPFLRLWNDTAHLGPDPGATTRAGK